MLLNVAGFCQERLTAAQAKCHEFVRKFHAAASKDVVIQYLHPPIISIQVQTQ